jgi:hypothetical protein
MNGGGTPSAFTTRRTGCEKATSSRHHIAMTIDDGPIPQIVRINAMLLQQLLHEFPMRNRDARIQLRSRQ